jgi:hypothetical protein
VDDDTILDGGDNCLFTPNTDQRDEVHPNGIGDACEDPDGDGVMDLDDNCPDIAQFYQFDCDQDGLGDPCDPGTVDLDEDDIDDLCDNCPETANPTQWNTDWDDYGDECDNCPTLAHEDRTDTDADGSGNPCDPDDDGDQHTDLRDNCPLYPNPGQEDYDADAAGDLCDNCPWHLNPGPGDLAVLMARMEEKHPEIADLVPDRYDFEGGESYYFILDGGEDMYDIGNYIHTSNRYYLSYSDRKIQGGYGAFGPDGQYFTAKYPGLWLLAVSGMDISHLIIDGNLGADGSGEAVGSSLQLESLGRPFTVFVKQVYDYYGPSVVHIILVPGSGPELTHTFSEDTNSDYHRVDGLEGVPSLYYLLVSQQSSGLLEDSDVLAIAEAFLAEAVGGPQPDEDGDGYGDVCDHPPTSRAGDDQIVECVSDPQTPVLLDGSASTDPDSLADVYDDLANYLWSEEGSAVGEGEQIVAGLALGNHTITLTVSDHAGASDTDEVQVLVEDTLAPAGAITFPLPGTCHGSDVTILDSFSDQCDPDLDRAYTPAPGPTYSEHGDLVVGLEVTDETGLGAGAAVSFTIDRIAPEVELLPAAPGLFAVPVPSTVAFSEVFRTDGDADGATGGVVREVLYWDGCAVFDGDAYGDGDGILIDEAVPVHQSTLCRVRHLCGVSEWVDPVLSVEASDCGGNRGTDEIVIPGAFAISAQHCGSTQYEVDSLRLQESENAGIRLVWDPASSSTGTELYRVWRRTRDASSFELLAETLGHTYVDGDSTGIDYEYEVTAIE